jgi:hypothetical protein
MVNMRTSLCTLGTSPGARGWSDDGVNGVESQWCIVIVIRIQILIILCRGHGIVVHAGRLRRHWRGGDGWCCR